MIVQGKVTVRQESENYVSLQWSSDLISDMVSDSVVAMILNISREGPKVMPVAEASTTEEDAENMEQKVIYALFASLFDDVKVGEEGKLVVTVDGKVVRLDRNNGEV
ncbi:cleavage and polyadenylation specificity factor subunit 3-I [Iris pallida]|uniref:Cleavage and polyadenylation specificity factor subunit 3-I n=1 Tax=Iris pallida TaxID=29817 RepID=A0AAX6G6L1_IRIPA|nr:cleavage and polyadenylation specificity factor subunit 3-I [Iris pallida]